MALFGRAPPVAVDSFETGCKLEAVDMQQPKLICVATVVDVRTEQ